MNKNQYRGWCANKNEWEKDLVMLSPDGTLYEVKDNGHFIRLRPDTHIVEFCTGLKDKNDTLIYEGDILWDDHSEEYAKVIFEEGQYILSTDTVSWSLYECVRDFEVVGNIHEHKELLEG